MTEPASAPAHRIWALAAGGTGVAALAVYLTLIFGQGDSLWAVFPWVALMTIPAVLALVAAFGERLATDRVLLLIAASIFGILGVLAALTIGVLFLIAGVAALIGWGRVARR